MRRQTGSSRCATRVTGEGEARGHGRRGGGHQPSLAKPPVAFARDGGRANPVLKRSRAERLGGRLLALHVQDVIAAEAADHPLCLPRPLPASRRGRPGIIQADNNFVRRSERTRGTTLNRCPSGQHCATDRPLIQEAPAVPIAVSAPRPSRSCPPPSQPALRATSSRPAAA